jgi:hypothetical protein
MTLAVVEAPTVLAMVVSRLLTDAGAGGVSTLVGGRVFRDAADEGTVLPFITVTVMSSQSLMTANAIHVWSDVVLLVKIVDQNSNRSGLEAIERRVVSQLDGYGDVTLRGVYLTMLRLERQAPQSDVFIDGKRTLFSNLVFRSEAQPA